MKIVCQSCSAKYSIADDKVQGKKVFKIKCKKCGEDILVRGEGAAEGAGASAADQFSEDEATRVVSPDAGGDATWHAVVNGDQQGPFAMAQLREMMGNGTIDPETYVWKDGFTDWKPMKDVPDLYLALAGSAPMGAAEEAPAAAGGDALFANAPASSGGGDGLFGASKPASSSGGGGLFGAPAGEAKARAGSKASGGGDLFGGESKPMFGGGGEEEVSTSASAGGGGGGAGGSATGARNENSVLFSLASLQQVAGASTPAKVSEPGAAKNNDMSGLIDIKSMASSLGNSKSKAVDDILTVGGGGALSSPLAAPVLAPVVAPVSAAEPVAAGGGTNKTVVFAAISVAVILVGGGLAAAMLLKGNQQPQQVVVQAPPPPATNPATTAAGTTPTTAAGTAPTTAAGTTAPAGGTQVAVNNETPGAATAGGNEAGGSRERSGSSGGGGGGSRNTRSGSSGGGGGGGSASAGTSAAASGGSGGSTASAGGSSGQTCAQRCHGDIDCLLRCSTQSSGGGGGGGGAHPASGGSGGGGAAAGGGPETPSRNDVLSAMNGVRSSVQACGQGMTGTASVSITFASTGRITTANVAPPFAGTPAGSCIARAVRSATVPSFTRPSFSVNFPFVIR